MAPVKSNRVGRCACVGMQAARRPSALAHTQSSASPAPHVIVTARDRVVTRAVAEPPVYRAVEGSTSDDSEFLNPERPVRVLVAGGGIAGLVLAVALLKKGLDVKVFEQDLTAIRGEGKYRGPIQVQSNALAALEAIDRDMAQEIMAEGCVTGDRINGLCDGVSGDWYVKFDTFHPAVKNGLPVTRVISRVTLQNILAKYACQIGGDSVIQADTKIKSFEEDVCENKDRVWAKDQNGEKYWGDVLIGADGIWSKVRKQLIGETQPVYSGYTCYTGISDFVCPDIDTVAYRVFLGNRQYFVSSDVGGGKMQWYAFHEEKAGGKDPEGGAKARLAQIFGKWNDMVTDLIAATPEDDVLRRDIYDRPPIFRWTAGRVALLGDSAHAMQPNLGQGGCMAIEDAYEFAKIMSTELQQRRDKGEAFSALDLPYQRMLQRYQRERIIRSSAIHGMARFAALAASTYKAYLFEQFKLDDMIKIPHPGRVAGRLAMTATMPFVLSWVLGGNTRKIRVEDRPQYCVIDDRPHGFEERDWNVMMRDDEALLKASRADWVLVPHGDGTSRDVEGAVAIEEDVVVGRAAGSDVHIDSPSVSDRHASMHITDGKYYIVDRETSHGTWLNGKQIATGPRTQLHPGDVIVFGEKGGKGCTYKVKQMHVSQRDVGLLSANDDGSARRYEVSWRNSRTAAAA